MSALITTIAGLTSDSYVSVSDALTYFAVDSHPQSATWLAYTPDQQTAFLRQACRDMNYLLYFGNRQDYAQSLAFPRIYYTLYLSGFQAGIIPQQIKEAQMEQALYIGIGITAGASSSRQALIAQGVTQRSLGDLSETYGGNGNQIGQIGSPLQSIGQSALRKLYGCIRTSSAARQIRAYDRDLETSNRMTESDYD